MVNASLVARTLPAAAARPGALSSAWNYGLVVAVVLLTRLPLWGAFTGEPDTARYVFGLRFWMRDGPDAPFIINRELSSGYYWLAERLVWLTDARFADLPRLLGALSLLAALVTAPALYHLGIRVVSPAVALVATVVLLLGPGWWWAGLQAHPQGLTLALQLVSLVAFVEAWQRTPARPSTPWLAASAVGLTAALLVKSDAALLFGAYVGLRLFQRSRQAEAGRVEPLWRSLLGVASVLAVAYAAFTGLHRLITGPLGGVGDQATAHIGRFLALPRGSELLSQLAPIVFAPGPIVFLAAVAGAAAFLVRAPRAARLRWAALLATWSLPGYVFWLAIAGNNARHVIPFAVPLVWLALASLERAGTARLLAAAAAVVAANLVVPANSGLSLYPSARVPRSVALMRERQDELQRAAARLMSGTQPSACYVGRTTQDFVTQYVLERADAAGYVAAVLPGAQLALRLTHADGRPFRRIDIIGLRDQQDAGINPRLWPGCAVVESLEYDAAGHRRRFFGTEPVVIDRLVDVLRGGPAPRPGG